MYTCAKQKMYVKNVKTYVGGINLMFILHLLFGFITTQQTCTVEKTSLYLVLG